MPKLDALGSGKNISSTWPNSYKDTFNELIKITSSLHLTPKPSSKGLFQVIVLELSRSISLTLPGTEEGIIIAYGTS